MAPQPPDTNFYSGLRLDRADHLRRDARWLAAGPTAAESRLVPVWRARSLIAGDAAGGGAAVRAVALPAAEAGPLIAAAVETAFLGLDGETAYFALALPDDFAPESDPALVRHGEFLDIRAVGPLLPRPDGALLAYARGLAHWHRQHRFCGACGAPTASEQGGHLRRCSASDCGAQHFPRTDPAVIMLVTDGERCVLGRQAQWPPGMHSVLAGFVETGESLEEAVAREVYEEVGIAVTEVAYRSSQPWPFPASIMLGFWARARHAPLRVNRHELAEADWYDRAALRASPEDERFRLPRRDSIARRLVEDWLDAG